MANNYCQCSAQMSIPKGKADQAQAIVDRITKELEEDESEGYVGIDVEVEEGGVWFCHGEYANNDHIEMIAKALVEELEIDEPFYCSWSYSCSKMRIDEFGGGAMKVQRGKDTVWVDAMSYIHDTQISDKERELKDALAELAIQTDEDCPGVNRSAHLREALVTAFELTKDEE